MTTFRRKMTSVLLATVMALGLPVSAFAASYEDVGAGAWYKEAVDFVSERGIMTGTAEGVFSPDALTTRGMVVAMLYRMEGEPSLTNYPSLGYPYEDVDVNAYYGHAVYWARYHEIVSGYSWEKFGPNDPVTREQLAAILYNYGAYKGLDMSEHASSMAFVDFGDISDWALAAIEWNVAQGILGGNENHELLPRYSATRAQVASVMMRMVNVLENPSSEYPKDVTSLPLDLPTDFIYASGAGAWASGFTLNSNLAFAGNYHDTDMGPMEVFYSYFNGQFSPNITQLNDYTYRLTLESIDVYGDEAYPGGDFVDEYGLHHIYVDRPVGLEMDASGGGGICMEYYLYTPEAPVATMNETFFATRPWLRNRTTLDCYGLENAATHQGFFAS